MSRLFISELTFLALLVTGTSAWTAGPHERIVVADAAYLMADTDTLAGAEENVLVRAKRKAVEEVAVYIEATSQDTEHEAGGTSSRSHSLNVRTIAAAITKTDILEKRRTLEHERLSFYVKVKVTVSLDMLDEAVKRQHAYDELAEHDRRVSSENSRLKAELDEMRSHARAAQPFSAVSASTFPDQPIEIIGDYRYFYHDPMTSEEANDLAYREAVRIAIDTAPPFINATAFIMDHAFRRHLIQIIASDYLHDVKLLAQTEKHRTVYAKIRATMNPQDVKSVVEREVGRKSEKELFTLGKPPSQPR